MSQEIAGGDLRRIASASMTLNREAQPVLLQFFSQYACDPDMPHGPRQRLVENLSAIATTYHFWNLKKHEADRAEKLFPAASPEIHRAQVDCGRSLCGLLNTMKKAVAEKYELHRNVAALLANAPATLVPVGVE